jgi:alkaline phosphatase D
MLNRRHFLAGVAPLPLLYWLKPGARAPKGPRTVITFGSCNEQERPQPIWRSIAASKPDLFIFCGDNVYADTEDMAKMRAAYDTLAANPDFAAFRGEVPVVATWDDHDYGGDDTGAGYPMKRESKDILLNFFGEPAHSSRWGRDGVYTSYLLGKPGRMLQVILLDLRWWKVYGGPLLGDEQWAWLEKQLRTPADVRLVVSSSQFAVKGSQWEKWDDHPADKARFLNLVDELELRNLVVLSGDMHYGELSRQLTPGGIELVDFTSSGLNRWETAAGIPNANRFALYDTGENFGYIEIDWDADPIQVKLELRDLNGNAVLKHLLGVKRNLNTVS